MVVASPGAIARNQALGNLLTQQGLQAQPIFHPLQGLSQIAQAAMGGYLVNKADRQQRERTEAANTALMDLLGGGSVGGPVGAPPPPSASGASGAPGGLPGRSSDTAALLELAGQFPELSGMINPLLAQSMRGPAQAKPLVLSPGETAFSPTGDVIARGEAAPAKFQTDLGKAVSDARLAEQTFGKDSPQAAAFREAAQRERAGGAVDLGDEAGQRKEFTKASGDFVKVRDAFGKIQKSKGTAAGDLALIFNYMKLLDPGSVVREGEFATAQNTAGVPDRVRNTYNRLLSGERLNPVQRQNFKAQAADVFIAQRDQQNLLEDEFGRIAAASGLRPQNVIVDFQGGLRDFSVPGAPEETAEAAPVAPAAPEGAPPAGSAATAVNPDTGEVVVWDGEKWVPQ